MLHLFNVRFCSMAILQQMNVLLLLLVPFCAIYEHTSPAIHVGGSGDKSPLSSKAGCLAPVKSASWFLPVHTTSLDRQYKGIMPQIDFLKCPPLGQVDLGRGRQSLSPTAGSLTQLSKVSMGNIDKDGRNWHGEIEISVEISQITSYHSFTAAWLHSPLWALVSNPRWCHLFTLKLKMTLKTWYRSIIIQAADF